MEDNSAPSSPQTPAADLSGWVSQIIAQKQSPVAPVNRPTEVEITVITSPELPSVIANSESSSGSSSIPSIDDDKYATQEWVEDQGYATKEWVEEQGYATEEWVEDKGYATEEWVEDKGYATEEWVEGKDYATKEWVEDKLSNYVTKEELSNYVRKDELCDLIASHFSDGGCQGTAEDEALLDKIQDAIDDSLRELGVDASCSEGNVTVTLTGIP